jgi:hypothetical protein
MSDVLGDIQNGLLTVQTGIDGVAQVVGAAQTLYTAYNGLTGGFSAGSQAGMDIDSNKRARSEVDPVASVHHAMRQAERLAQMYGAGGSGYTTPSTGVQVVPAQFINGRGAELGYTRMNLLNPIKFKTGESAGPRAVSAWEKQVALFKPQVVQHAFAFKMVLVPPSTLQTSESLPVSRFFVHNCFRHLVPQVTNVDVPTGSYGANNTNWNESLGPDKSLVRITQP